MTPEQFELFARIEEEHWWFVARREILRRVVARIAPVRPDPMLLDIGCGTGANVAAFADAFRCVGVDENADAIRLARARFPRVDFAQTHDPAGIDARVAEADVILCTDVIEHIEHERPFVARVVHAMTSGSQLLLTVPAEMSLWSEHDVTNHHFRRYDATQLGSVWQGLPVRLRLLSAFNARLYPMVKAARALGRLRGGAHGEAGTDFAMPHPLVNRALRRLFAGEAPSLLAAIDSPHRPYRRGVSLIAVLEREPSAGRRA